MAERTTRSEYDAAPRRKVAGRNTAKKRRRKRRLRPLALLPYLLMLVLVVFLGKAAVTRIFGRSGYSSRVISQEEVATRPAYTPRTTMDDWPNLDVQLIDVNEYSRPGIALKQVKGIVVHYTANPGSSAQANRDYFANLEYTHTTKASSHFVVGLEGEIIQLIPCNEISYASNDRNSDTLAIECCIEDESGKFNQATYDSTVELVAWLVYRYGLSVDDVIRHYDVTGKICPKYFVDHPEEWDAFREDVRAYIEKYS